MLREIEMNTYKIFSGLERCFIEILRETNLFYRFEYIEWSGNHYLHINGRVPNDIHEKIKSMSY